MDDDADLEALRQKFREAGMSDATFKTVEAEGQRLYDRGYRIEQASGAELGQHQRPVEQSPTHWQDRVTRSENRNAFRFGREGSGARDDDRPGAGGSGEGEYVGLIAEEDQVSWELPHADSVRLHHQMEQLANPPLVVDVPEMPAAEQKAPDTQAMSAMLQEASTADRAVEEKAVDQVKEQERAKEQEQAQAQETTQDRE